MERILDEIVQAFVLFSVVGTAAYIVYLKFFFNDDSKIKNKPPRSDANQNFWLGDTSDSHQTILSKNRAIFLQNISNKEKSSAEEFLKNYKLKEWELLQGGPVKLDAITAIFLVKNWKRFDFLVAEDGKVYF